jgi:hypothetical protein
MVAGRDVKAPIAAAHGSFEPFGVRQIARHGFKGDIGRPPSIGAWPEQGFNRVALCNQFMDKVRANKP